MPGKFCNNAYFIEIRLMPQFAIALLLIVFNFSSLSVYSEEKKNSNSSASSIDRKSEALFRSGEAIHVAQSRHLSQIGRGEKYRSMVVGVADVFGNGPYDLFLLPNQLFPFRGFHQDGSPYYGKPVQTRGQPMGGVVFTGPEGMIYGVVAAGKKVRVCVFDKATLSFQQYALSKELNLPRGMGGAITSFIDVAGKLHVYFAIGDGVTYRPPGDHHAATYIPYDGAGFWRGNIVRRKLYHARFDTPSMKKIESVTRAKKGPGEFLFNVGGMSIVNLGKGHIHDLITSEKQGVFRYFKIAVSTGEITSEQFVNNKQHVALRHPVINANLKAIQDPQTGLSNLIVGDSGRIWFYNFSGQFTKNGSPIYGTPKPVQAEGIPLFLGELPVLSSGDVDNDGLVDLITGNDAGELLFIKNIGNKQKAEFDNPVPISVAGRFLKVEAGYRGSIQGPGEAMWGYTCPALYDWNGDGLLDVILNSIMADYMVLLQQPSKKGPQFSKPKRMYCDGLQLHLAWRSRPAITDWGTKDKICLIALDEKNLLRQFWRIDNQNVERGELLRLKDGSPITANIDEAAGQTGRAKLVAHDWDGDGAIDLLIGASRGLSFPASKNVFLPSSYGPTRQASVLYLRNIGSNTKPVFDYIKQLDFKGTRIGLGIHSCSPVPIDLGRGVTDLLVGKENGVIRYYPRENLSISTPVR